MGFRDYVPDMADVVEAYYARLDEERERLLHSVTCSDCACYTAAPAKWVTQPCGYCSECEEIVEGDVIVAELGCEDFAGWAA